MLHQLPSDFEPGVMVGLGSQPNFVGIVGCDLRPERQIGPGPRRNDSSGGALVGSKPKDLPRLGAIFLFALCQGSGLRWL